MSDYDFLPESHSFDTGWTVGPEPDHIPPSNSGNSEHRLLDSWSKIVNIVESIPVQAFLYRGQANSSWPLEPSICRLGRRLGASAKEVLDMERRGTIEFQAIAHQYLPPAIIDRLHDDDDLGWWMQMQHHRAPTRLIDWTRSIYVAIYFACVDEQESDGAVFLVNPEQVMNLSNTRCSELRSGEAFHRKKDRRAILEASDGLDWGWFFSAKRRITRMQAQQGMLGLTGNILNPHEATMKTVLGDAYDNYFGKLIIPQDRKDRYLLRLREINITAASLFPGLDGVGQSIAELLITDSVAKQVLSSTRQSGDPNIPGDTR